VSRSTADEFAKLGAREDQERTVILNPLNYSYTPAGPEAVEAMRKDLGLVGGEEYLLHIGDDSWYKNRSGAIRIYKALIDQLKKDGRSLPKMVLAGRELSVEMRNYIAEHRLAGLVMELMRPTNQYLQTLYTGAKALLFPSLHEGFGWPLLEAQSCGCPVITSNRAPMTEVAGQAALLIDPEDEEGAAQAIAGSLGGLAEQRCAGFENLKRFDRDWALGEYEKFFAAAAQVHS
jgi:glycosyltransferase involved in cell wall biosynthesis